MKVLFTTGALLGALAVVAGAFGAHKLRDLLEPGQLQSFETAVRYQFYHVLAILLAGLLAAKYPQAAFGAAGWLFVAGIVLFSGSIYLLACRDLLGLDAWARWLGPVTPLGGLVFIAGWSALAISFYKNF